MVGFVTPDANGAHPLGQLMAGALRRFDPAKCAPVLFTLCRDDGSSERRDFAEGCRAVVDVTGWRPLDIAVRRRREEGAGEAAPSRPL